MKKKKSKRCCIKQDHLDEGGPIEVPFILCKLEMSEKKFKHTKGSIIRYESIKFGIQEFFLQIENNLFSDNVRFVVEIMKVFSLDHSADDRMSVKEDYKMAK